MASKNEEYIAVAAVLITLVILSFLCGVFWSFLLVFTFLLLAYLSRRPQSKKKITTKKYETKPESLDNSLNDNKYLSDGGKEMDVPFTGLPSPKYQTQTLRSPMPLLSSLSTVTKRLSFNVSSLSPPGGKTYMLGNASRRFNTTIGSPRQVQSPMSLITSPQAPKYFSLINPSLQPSTVKIAAPEFNNRTLTIDEPKKLTDSPLSRATILSALKQSTIRKRSVVEDEDGKDDVSSPRENHKKKRRYHYPSENENERRKPMTTTDTTDLEITGEIIPEPPAVTRRGTGIYSLIQARLKRRPLHNDGNSTNEEGGVMIKKTKQDDDKTIGLPKVPESIDSECQDTKDVQTKSASSVTTKRIASITSYDDDNDSGCDADDDDDIVMKTVQSTTGETRLSKKQAQKLVEQNREKRKRIELRTSSTPSHTPEKPVSRTTTHTPDRTVSRTTSHTPVRTVSGRQRISKKQRLLNTPSVSEVTTSATDSPASGKSDVSGQEMKRFTVIRFPSKKDESKRRPVPVYCASVNSPDLPKRRPVTHKITKEDIELDRKLAWQRVQSLLDESEDEEEGRKPKGTSPSVAIHVTTCMPSPSRSQTSTVTTASGTLATSSTLVSSNSKESQDTTVATSQTAIIAPSIGTTQPSTLLSSLATSKPSEANPLRFVPQSESSATPLLANLDQKSSTFLKEAALATSSAAGLPSGQAILSSTTQLSSTPGFSLTSTTSTTGQPPAPVSAPMKNLFGVSATDSSNTTSLTSLPAASQSIQTPICTPVAQILLGTKTTNTIPGVPVVTAPGSLSVNFGSTVSKPPQLGSINLSNRPQNQFSVQSNLPQMGSTVTSKLTGFTLPSNVTQMGPKSNLPPAGFNTSSNAPQPGFSFSATTPSDAIQATVTTGAKTALFSGLNVSTVGSTLQNAAKVTTQAAQSGFATPETFSFSASTAPKTTSQVSTFNFAVSQQTSAPRTYGFQACTGVFGATPATTTTKQSDFTSNLTTTNKGFATASSSNQFAVQPPPYSSSTPAFGIAPSVSHNLFGKTSTTATPGGLKFGTSTATQSVFGNAAQPTATGSGHSGQFSFSAGTNTTPNQSQNKQGTSFPAGVSSTSASQPFTASSSRSNFGPGANTNVFGTSATPTPFGSTTNQNAFGSPATKNNQNAFGPTSQSTFGSPAPPQNVFGNPASSSSAGSLGFGNSSATPSAGGFKFGGGSSGAGSSGAGSSSGFQSTARAAPTFGSTPSAAPTASAGGFNFGAGSTASTPAFGASTPSAGGFKFGSVAQAPSSSVAKARPKATATRRRTRK